MIAFVGSVFSPYYYWAGYQRPENHCSINVALYGRPGRWSMTERAANSMQRDSSHFRVGRSQLDWDGNSLVISVDERCAPLPFPLRGTIKVSPKATTDQGYQIDHAGRHSWWPIAPVSRVEVRFDAPSIHWSGKGYFDSNWGTEPIARGFRRWDWSRADLSDGTAVLYDVTGRDGRDTEIAVRFGEDGRAERFTPPPRQRLANTLWRVPRQTQAELDTEGQETARVVRTLEDTPFYARSELSTRLCGQQVVGMHESLDLDRLDRMSTRLMLPFRMPRNPFQVGS